MDKTALVKKIEATIGKTKVLELSRILREQHFALHDLIAVTFHPDKKVAFRAAWILENVFLLNPEVYLPDLEYLLSRYSDVKHQSCKRHYVKIMMHITAPGAPQSIQTKLCMLNLEPVTEQLFDWLIDPSIKIAVKVFAAEALFNLRHRYTWITEELTSQLQFLMRNGTAAIQARGKKLLKEMAR